MFGQESLFDVFNVLQHSSCERTPLLSGNLNFYKLMYILNHIYILCLISSSTYQTILLSFKRAHSFTGNL